MLFFKYIFVYTKRNRACQKQEGFDALFKYGRTDNYVPGYAEQ